VKTSVTVRTWSGSVDIVPTLFLEVLFDECENAQVEDLNHQLRLVLFKICHFQLLPDFLETGSFSPPPLSSF